MQHREPPSFERGAFETSHTQHLAQHHLDFDLLSFCAPVIRPRAVGVVPRRQQQQPSSSEGQAARCRRAEAAADAPDATAYPSIAEFMARRSCPDKSSRDEVGDKLTSSPVRRGAPRRRSVDAAALRQRSVTASALPPSLLAERPNTIQRFLAEYRKGEMLGQGSTGAVFAVTAKKTGVEYACKFMKLDKAGSSASAKEVRKELHMLTVLSDHPNFVSIHDYFLSDSTAMIVMDRLEGGDLASYVKHKRGRLPEDDCREITRNLLEGLAFLHTAGAAHRDIKFENIMLARKDDLSSVKIVDMGLSKFMGSSKHTVCGSPLYLAPEALLQTATSADGRMKARYDERIDMWACGIVLYILLSGHQPYRTKTDQGLGHLIREIASCSIAFEGPAWKTVSPDALHLLRDSLLNYDPSQRIRAREALSHPFFHNQY